MKKETLAKYLNKTVAVSTLSHTFWGELTSISDDAITLSRSGNQPMEIALEAILTINEKGGPHD